MFVDDQMRGFIAKNCPPQTTFFPLQYFGNVAIAGCRREYGTINFARTYANPYGESMLNMLLFRVGRCGDNISNVLDDCGETGNSSSGPECKWGVFQLSVGSNFPILSNDGNDRGLMFPDVTTQTNCYDCWYNGNDTIERSLPINAKNEDKLNDLTITKSSWGGQDLPGPLFTYGKSGSPILSRIVTQSLYGSSDFDYRYLYDYVVTGHKGDDIQVGDAIFQNFAGGTGICSYPFDSTFGFVFAYSKDTGRLLLSSRTSHPVLSSDILIRCDETLRPVGATYGTTSGYVQGTLGFQSCEEISPSTSAGGWKFNHYLGRPGYGYTKKSSGLPYPNDTEVASWMSIERGGPRVLGNFWWYGLWYEGFPQSRIQNSKKDDCTFAEIEDPVASSNELYLGTHNMGMFLSDQPIYYRSADPDDPNKYYYFGKVEDIFYRMLNDFNDENGVTGDYRCTKEIIKFDGESDAYNYPNSIRVPVLKSQHPSLTRIYAGVNIKETEFLK
jgi:hypothetical protein